MSHRPAASSFLRPRRSPSKSRRASPTTPRSSILPEARLGESGRPRSRPVDRGHSGAFPRASARAVERGPRRRDRPRPLRGGERAGRARIDPVGGSGRRPCARGPDSLGRSRATARRAGRAASARGGCSAAATSGRAAGPHPGCRCSCAFACATRGTGLPQAAGEARDHRPGHRHRPGHHQLLRARCSPTASPSMLRSRDGYNTIPSVVALNRAGQAAGQPPRQDPAAAQPAADHLRRQAPGGPRLRQRRRCSRCASASTTRSSPDPPARPRCAWASTCSSLEEVQGIILRECKEMAEQHLGQKVERAVVTVPGLLLRAAARGGAQGAARWRG